MPSPLSTVAIIAAVSVAASLFGLASTLAQTALVGETPLLIPPAQLQAQLQAQVPGPTPAPAAPLRTEQIVQDAWIISCAEMAGGKKTCSATVKVAEKQQNRVIFVWVIGRTAEGVLTSAFQGPTGVQIQKGIDIKFAKGAPRKAHYVLCNQQQCEASIPMDDAMVKEALAAVNGDAVASITAADGRVINITMPLKGIDKVLAAIRR